MDALAVPLEIPERDLAFLSALTRHEIYRKQDLFRQHCMFPPDNGLKKDLTFIYVDFNLISLGETSVSVGPPDSLRPVDYEEDGKVRKLWDELVE